MIKCSKCSFAVSQDMKFALLKNSCPSCGGHLFSEKEQNTINHLRKKIGAQHFAAGFEPTMINDIALYFMNELKNGIGQVYLQESLSNQSEDGSEGNTEQELDDLEKKRIRMQIERELRAAMNEDESDDYEEEEQEEYEDDNVYVSEFETATSKRADSLRKKAAAGRRMTGPAVRRVE
jgi:DNA-directed RNA polymerase subunit RPC12/RpoP